jgi:hypothetical protein
MNDLRNFLSALAWFAGLLTLQVILHELGHAYPLPAFNAEAAKTWVTQTDSTVIALSLVRIATMTVIWYVLTTTTICAIAHLSPQKRFATYADRITLPGARVLAIRLASVSAIGGLALPVATANAAPSHEAPVLRHLLPGEAIPTTTTTTSTTAPLPTPITTAPAPISTLATQQHAVQRGENFWTIAQDALTATLQRNPSEKEVTEYWRELVRTNQQTLTNPSNPDLLFAGQIIELPPV